MSIVPVIQQEAVEDTEQNVPVKALIVDDSDLDRLVLQKMLMKNGYDVYVASNGHMAIEIYKQSQPDIIFMDLYLPEISGYETTINIKKLSQRNYVPIIFVTSANESSVLEKCLDSGGDDFIVKPVKEGLLRAKVGALLRIKRMHDQIMQRKRALRHYIENQEKDLYDADKVIYNIHKPQFYNSGNLDWAYLPQNILSGDIICSAIGPSGNHIILIGDNTGHGLPAAIGSMISCETFYGMTNKGFDVSQIILELNKKLCCLLPVDRFLAACIIEFTEDGESVNIWNAGLPNILICDSNGELKQKIPSLHFPLGIKSIRNDEINLIKINIEQNDRVYAYTDGITDAFNKSGQIYGEDGLLNAIRSASVKEERVQSIIDDLNQFTDNAIQNDDVLLMEAVCDKSKLNKNKKNEMNFTEKLPMPWRFSFEAQAPLLSTVNPVPVLMQLMSELQGLGLHREKLFLILSEMYSNALEHGVLGLDSSIKQQKDGFINYYKLRESKLKEIDDANISIDIQNWVEGSNGVVSISIEDSGDGFDLEKTENDLVRNNTNSGRGIGLLKKLCRKFEYSINGRRLDIEYEWNNDSTDETV